MRMTRMELLGVAVTDFDAAVQRFTSVFGLEFYTFTPTIDYALDVTEQGVDTAPARAATERIAMDTSGCFEIAEISDGPEGMRNIHFRVDDMDAAKAHVTNQGLRVVADMMAGTVREVIFDARDLHGLRLCLVAYDGPSFAAALRESPRPA